MAGHQISKNGDQEKSDLTITGRLLKYMQQHDDKSFHGLIFASMRTVCQPALTLPKLAERIGITEYQLRMTIIENPDRKIMNRDLIIAICIAAGLDKKNTDNGLALYRFLPLNEKDTRDKLISDVLYETEDPDNKKNRIPIVQERLRSANEKILQLNVGKEPEIKLLNIRREKNDIEIISKNIYCGEFPALNGINDHFWPSNYGVEGIVVLRKKGEATRYRISYEGEFMITGGRFSGFGNTFINSEDCPIPEFSEECRRLRGLSNERYDKMHDILDDTKNYRMRCDCSYSDGIINVFAETFDYEDPEHGRYYQMKKHGTTYSMSITDKSIFLRKHVPDEYTKFYPENRNIPILYEFLNHKEISEQHRINADTFTAYQATRAHKMYECLKHYVEKIVQDIRSGRKCVYDIRDIDEYYYDPAAYYGMADKFNFKQVQYSPDSRPEYEPQNRIALIKLHNKKKVIISIDDLRRAYSLGIPKKELINILERFGTVDGCLI